MVNAKNLTTTSNSTLMSPTKSSIAKSAQQASTNTPSSQTSKPAMAYADKIATVKLDGSLASLKRVDIMLSSVRHELIGNDITEADFLASQANRKFMLFLGQYIGHVLAKLRGVKPQWLTIKQLTGNTNQDIVHLTKSLVIKEKNFYHRLACHYHSANEPEVLFFVLEPIGARLFSSVDRFFTSVNGKQVQSSVFLAVQDHAPAANMRQSTADNVDLMGKAAVNNHAEQSADISSVALPPVTDSLSLQKQPTDQNVNSGINSAIAVANSAASIKSNKTPLNGVDSSGRAVNTTKKSPVTKKVNVDNNPIVILNNDLLKDIQALPHEQKMGAAQYQQAIKILDVFEGFIRSQNRPRAEVKLSPKHSDTRQKAVALLEQAAAAGNTSAMLRLAMQQMLGEGAAKDIESGVTWVQKAASLDDARAQRLLSKLFYQGIGVPQDLTQGKHWLTKAAANHHPDALAVLASWQQLETLADVKKQDAVTDKRYLILVAGVVLLAVVLFIVV